MVQGALPAYVIRVVQVVLALFLLAVLWRIADGEEALRLLAGADPGWLVASFGVLTLQTVLSALRWQITAGQLGIVFDSPTAIREYYLSQIVNQSLPGGILGDAGRAVRARTQAGLVISTQAVVLERIAGQVALFAVMFVAFAITWALPGGLDWPLWLSLVVIALTGGTMGLLLALVVIARKSSGRLGRGLVSFRRAAVRAFAPRSVRWSQMGLSLGTAVANVTGFVFAAWAIGSHLSIFSALALVPMILLAMLIPLTIGGWGLREGAAAALFPLAGLAAAEGLAASVAFGLVFLAVALPGVFFLAGSPDKRRPGGTAEESA
jgi:uncharacterized membrane protein YbhN (UPF0104 family)